MTSTIKAISLWQPWASLVAVGAKKYETRHWSTNYRGLLAIHAAKTTESLKNYARYANHFRATYGPEAKFRDGEFMRYFVDAMKTQPQYQEKFTLAMLPLGSVLCVVRLIDVILTQKIAASLDPAERAFGNYEHGRYAWKLEMVRMFDEPIPYKGAQGFFDVKLPEGITL